ncbi:MAG: hypothetical protein HFJ51_05240 [Clostridia bacterium]|nr:hypothetical protein [Clostridia bacterium]
MLQIGIKEALEKQYPEAEIHVIDCMRSLNRPINYITVKLYEGFAKRMPKLWGWVYKKSRKGIIATFSNSVNKMLAGKLGKLIEKVNPDLIISAHPFSTQMCGILKKRDKLKLEVSTIMTDFKYHEQWLEKHEYLEKFFVSNDKMRNDLIKYGLEENRVFAMRNAYISKIFREI